MAAEVANIYRAFTCYFIGLGGWPFMEPVIPWVPIPFKEAATESPHDIKSNRCIDFKIKINKKALLSLYPLPPFSPRLLFHGIILPFHQCSRHHLIR